jgi:ribosomal protein S18 acetylase RimI-like enzyme
MKRAIQDVVYREKPPLDNDALNALYTVAWPHHSPCDFSITLAVCMTYFGAFAPDGEWIGFVKVAWDGETHAFLLEPTVHPAWRHMGIGRELVRLCAEAGRAKGLEWLHVDYDPELASFYAACGFVPTPAGLIKLNR